MRVYFRSLFVLGIVSLAHGENSLCANSPKLDELVRSDAAKASSAPELSLAKELAVKLNALAARGTSEAVQSLASEELESLMQEVMSLRISSEEMSRSLVTEAEGKASAGLFRVTGEIKQRDETKVVLWGRSLPVNFDSKQLGTLTGEGNIVVQDPDANGIQGGMRYVGTHSFIRTQEGTNAFGGTVPVLVYGKISNSTQRRIDDLRSGERILVEASSSLYQSYARIRRAILANKHSRLALSDELNSKAASRFILAVAGSRLDQHSYFKQGKPAFGGSPLGWSNLRSDVQSKDLRGFGVGHDIVYDETGVILGFLGANLGWRTRIHDRDLLARYFPEEVSKLETNALFALPDGSEALLNVLLNPDRKKRCAAMKNYTQSIVQNVQCPEIVNILLTRDVDTERSEQVSILCYWDGKTTRVLTSTIFESGVAFQDRFLFFNLDAVSANPLPFAW